MTIETKGIGFADAVDSLVKERIDSSNYLVEARYMQMVLKYNRNLSILNDLGIPDEFQEAAKRLNNLGYKSKVITSDRPILNKENKYYHINGREVCSLKLAWQYPENEDHHYELEMIAESPVSLMIIENDGLGEGGTNVKRLSSGLGGFSQDRIKDALISGFKHPVEVRSDL